MTGAERKKLSRVLKFKNDIAGEFNLHFNVVKLSLTVFWVLQWKGFVNENTLNGSVL